MKRLFFLATTMLLLVSCGGSASKSAAPAESAPEAEVAPVEAEVDLPKVYSNCYDGYLNVRAQPTTKSQILGRFNNGPEGAELLGVEGNWSKVRVNGVEGYVSSNYLQSTPTEPAYLDANVILGEWIYDFYKSNGVGPYWLSFLFKSNGTCNVRMDGDVDVECRWRIVANSLHIQLDNETIKLQYDGSKGTLNNKFGVYCRQ